MSAEDVFEDVLEDVVGEKPLVNFFLIERYALYGVSVMLYEYEKLRYVLKLHDACYVVRSA